MPSEVSLPDRYFLAGKCTRCGKRPPEKNVLTCSRCRAMINGYAAKRRQERVERAQHVPRVHRCGQCLQTGHNAQTCTRDFAAL